MFANIKVITSGVKLFADNYPGLASSKEFVAVPFTVQVVMAALKRAVPDVVANSHTCKKADSLGRKYLPPVAGSYPLEYCPGGRSMDPGAESVHLGRSTLFDDDQSSVMANDAARDMGTGTQTHGHSALTSNDHALVADPAARDMGTQTVGRSTISNDEHSVVAQNAAHDIGTQTTPAIMSHVAHDIGTQTTPPIMSHAETQVYEQPSLSKQFKPTEPPFVAGAGYSYAFAPNSPVQGTQLDPVAEEAHDISSVSFH